MMWIEIKRGELWQGENNLTIVRTSGKYHVVRNVNGVQVEKGSFYTLDQAKAHAESL
jgi:hypothetical protein